MTDTPRLLICNPDEPGWIHGPSMGAYATADFCEHAIRISPAGVSMLLSMAGLKTCCFLCIPSDAEDFYTPPEIRQHFLEVTGKELGDDVIEIVQFFAELVKERNRKRGR